MAQKVQMDARLLLFLYHHHHHCGIKDADRIEEARITWVELQEGIGIQNEKGLEVTAQKSLSLKKTGEFGKGRERLQINNGDLFEQWNCDVDPGWRDPCVVVATDKFTQTREILWRKRDDGMATL